MWWRQPWCFHVAKGKKPAISQQLAWKYYGVRPESGAANRTRTDGRYCVWDEAHGDYVYTDAWIRKLATELADREKFCEVIGHDPIPLPDTQTDLAPIQGTRDTSPNEAAAA